MQRGNHQCSHQGKRERCRCTIVVTPYGRGSRPGGRHATQGPTQVGPWWFQVGMVSLPGWGGPWERRERLGSDSSDNAKKRYNLPHPRVQQTFKEGLTFRKRPMVGPGPRCLQEDFELCTPSRSDSYEETMIHDIPHTVRTGSTRRVEQTQLQLHSGDPGRESHFQFRGALRLKIKIKMPCSTHPGG